MWSKIRRLVLVLPAALLAALLTVQPVLAAAPARPAASTVDMGCEAGVCRFELDLGAGASGYWLRVLAATVNRLPGGVSMEVGDDVLLTLPIGTLVLPDADLTVEFGPDHRIVALHGTTQMPVPTFGLLGALQWVTPARVDVGYGLGADLAALQAPLDPDRRYFYMTFDAGLAAVSRGDQPPLELIVPSGQHTVLVVDPTQPLLYVDGTVNLRYMGDLAFVRQLLDPASGLAWWPTGLALPQAVEVGINGVIGQDVAPNLELHAAYRLESGVFGQWFRLDGALVEAEGSLTLGPQGLLLAGKAHSALMPQAAAAEALAAQLYIPIEMLQAPAVAGVQAAEAMIAAGEGALEEAQLGRLAGLAVSSRAGLVTGADTVADTVAEAAQAGYGAVLNGTQQGIGWIAGTVGSGMQYTNEQWCALSGRCGAALATAQDRARLAGMQPE